MFCDFLSETLLGEVFIGPKSVITPATVKLSSEFDCGINVYCFK